MEDLNQPSKFPEGTGKKDIPDLGDFLKKLDSVKVLSEEELREVRTQTLNPSYGKENLVMRYTMFIVIAGIIIFLSGEQSL